MRSPLEVAVWQTLLADCRLLNRRRCMSRCRRHQSVQPSRYGQLKLQLADTCLLSGRFGVPGAWRQAAAATGAGRDSDRATRSLWLTRVGKGTDKKCWFESTPMEQAIDVCNKSIDTVSREQHLAAPNPHSPPLLQIPGGWFASPKSGGVGQPPTEFLAPVAARVEVAACLCH